MDVVASPTSVGFNKQSGAPKLALQPGQIVDALVLQVIDSTTVRLSIADTVFDIQTEVALVPGSTVRLAVKGTGSDLKLVIVGTSHGAVAESARRLAAAPAQPPTAADVPVGDARLAEPIPHMSANATEAAKLAAGLDPSTALDLAVRGAAARQGSLAPLFADLSEAVAVLPAPVRHAAMQVLALRLPADDGVTANALKSAVLRSGLFLERSIAHAAANGTPVPSAAEDLKGALLALRGALKAWFGSDPPLVPAAMHPIAPANTPPPYRGATPVAQPPVQPDILPGATPHEIGDALIERTEGALARQMLLQAASLPESGGARPIQPDAGGVRWSFEVPFTVPQGTTVAQFEVARDGSREPVADREQTWRVNFSIDVEPLGPVHAQVSIAGQRAAVRLWAERGDAAAVLRESAGELSRALRSVALEPGDIVVRDGAPPRPVWAAPAGRFLDRAS